MSKYRGLFTILYTIPNTCDPKRVSSMYVDIHDACAYSSANSYYKITCSTSAGTAIRTYFTDPQCTIPSGNDPYVMPVKIDGCHYVCTEP
jgi:hypothetical protein